MAASPAQTLVAVTIHPKMSVRQSAARICEPTRSIDCFPARRLLYRFKSMTVQCRNAILMWSLPLFERDGHKLNSLRRFCFSLVSPFLHLTSPQVLCHFRLITVFWTTMSLPQPVTQLVSNSYPHSPCIERHRRFPFGRLNRGAREDQPDSVGPSPGTWTARPAEDVGHITVHTAR